MKITGVIGREIFDSRGYPTIECELILDESYNVIASVPAGKSRGSQEVKEVRDANRLMGKGVSQAVQNLEQYIAPLILNQEPDVVSMDLRMIEVDGTPDKSHLGGNTMLAASIAIIKAQAVAHNMRLYELIARLCAFESVGLPFCMFNIINGGVHADNNLQIQEFMIAPMGATNFRESLEIAVIIYHTLKDLLHKNNKSTGLGDEGGFAPNFEHEREALDYIMQAIKIAGYEQPGLVSLALDVASTEFYNKEEQTYNWHGKQLSAMDMIGLYKDLISAYPIYSIEDGLSESDWEHWPIMTAELGKVQTVGDDLFVTHIDKIVRGIETGAASAVLIKPNQIGTVTETLQAIKLAKEYELNTVVSHRSGETNDTFIADLAVGTSSGQFKSGACARGERIAKYNRLLRIEDLLMMSLLNN